MSIASITTRITKEAQAYSDDRRAQAEAAKRETLEEARRQADEIREQRKADAARDAEMLKSRRQSVADLDSRKMQLAAKQAVIDESYAAALDKLLSLSPEEYVQFLSCQLEEYKDEGGEVLLNADDRERYGSQLEKSLKGTALTLSKDTADIRGGCILRRGNISYNASIEKLLDTVRTELTAEVAGVLFE